jgi:hypothetical protein
MADSAHQHDIDAAHEAQDKARLNIWVGIRCPIPSCKRNKPSGTPEPAPSYPTEQSLPIHAGNEYASRLVSGVPHYPPPPSAPPAYTTSSSDPPSPLLDVTVDKVIQLVLGEAERQDKERLANSMMIREPVSPPGDDSSDDDEVVDQGPSTGSVSLTRVASKRRRHRVDQYNRSRPTTADGQWPFEKDLLGVLECDVCASLLYDPVTTPCQHVSCKRMSLTSDVLFEVHITFAGPFVTLSTLQTRLTQLRLLPGPCGEQGCDQYQ